VRLENKNIIDDGDQKGQSEFSDPEQTEGSLEQVGEDSPDETAQAETSDAESPEELAPEGFEKEERKRSSDKIPLYGIKPEDAAQGIDTFLDLPLHEKVRDAVRKIGWAAPTPVQKLCLPYTLRGRHVAGFAQTGTGKTAVFLLTICNQILSQRDLKSAGESSAPADGESARVQAVVLAPTRELALQIEQDAEVMLREAGLVAISVIGGIDYDKQVKKLKEGVDIVFATPGRLKDYVQKKYVDLSHVQVFVCDEADRMFDMGFIEDVEFFLEKIPEESQKLLFSATTNDQVKELAFEYLETPEYISVNPEELTPEKIEQKAYHCHATQKLRVMLGMLKDHQPECSIIFTNTKLTAEWLHFKLEKNGIEADLITGDLPQKKRIRLIQRIKDGKLKALIATDVASRGLHISRITHVYNFDLPEDPANYVHRIGRTARAGAKGHAYSLVCDDYGHNLNGINSLLSGHFTLESVWPPDSYLEIVDIAGNPFADRYKSREFDRGRDSQRGRQGRERPEAYKETQKGRESRPFDRDRPRSADRKREDRDHGRKQGKHKNFQQGYGQQEQRDQGRQGRRDRQRPHERVLPRENAEITQNKFSFMDLVRKLFRALFGWKSKK
jgi:ATP-dependent RNA helicase RhlB